MSDIKPLAYTPPDYARVGFTAERLPDGGMHLTFTDLTHETLIHWQEFAVRHLQDAERQNRNLYDLRAIDQIPAEALELAAKLNSDPAAKFIRLAIVVSSPAVESTLRQIEALSLGAEIEIFTDMAEAGAWLDRPFSRLLAGDT